MKRLIRKASISESLINELGDDWENYIENLYEYIHHNDKNSFYIMQSILDKYPNFKSYLNSLVSGQTLYRGITVDKMEDLDNFELNEKDYVSTTTDKNTALKFSISDNSEKSSVLITYQATECIFHYQMLNEEIDQDWDLEKEVLISTSTARIINTELV